jgi:hypothetical protein
VTCSENKSLKSLPSATARELLNPAIPIAQLSGITRIPPETPRFSMAKAQRKL